MEEIRNRVIEEGNAKSGENGNGSAKAKRHRRYHPVNENNFLAVTLLNLVISIVEVAGGILSGSLSLLSHALHHLSNSFAAFIGFFAILIGKRNTAPKKISGYQRREMLAALVNAVILLVSGIFLLREAWARWNDPRPLVSLIMIVVAMIGLLANLYGLIILRKHSKKSIHVRTAFFHQLSGSISSLAVIAGGVLIQLFGFWWIDPLITLLISAYLLREAFVILKESVKVLFQTAPENLDLQRVKRHMEQFPPVLGIHHLHTWMQNDRAIHLEAHIELKEDLKLSQVKQVRQDVEQMLRNDFHISHLTLQFEFDTRHTPHLINQQEYS